MNPRRWYVYHSRLACRATDPLQVRSAEWIRQCIVAGEEQAARCAREITAQGVHAKITGRGCTRHFQARQNRPVAPARNVRSVIG